MGASASIGRVAWCAAVLGAIVAFLLSSTFAGAALRAASSVGFEPGPLSVATDSAGDVYLSNPQANGQVQKFSPEGQLLASWGNFGFSLSNFLYPRDVAVDADGNVYVGHSIAGQLEVFAPDGTPLRQWPSASRAVAIGPGGYVYVLGHRSGYQVEKFTAVGTLVTTWGGGTSGGTAFGEPWGIAVAPSGDVYVADTYGDKIQVFHDDGSFVTSWGGHGGAHGKVVFPYGIDVGPEGDVYVADTANNRVQKFTADGHFISILGGAGRAPGHFYTPMSVATDAAGNVYVADAGVAYGYAGARARVQKFTAGGKFVTQWGDAPALPRPARPRLFSALGKRTAKRAATFRFRSRQRGVRFQCRLRGQRVRRRLRHWRGCRSPQRYTGLRPGRKLFQVRALKGIEAGRPAAHAWRIVS